MKRSSFVAALCMFAMMMCMGGGASAGIITSANLDNTQYSGTIQYTGGSSTVYFSPFDVDYTPTAGPAETFLAYCVDLAGRMGATGNSGSANIGSLAGFFSGNPISDPIANKVGFLLSLNATGNLNKAGIQAAIWSVIDPGFSILDNHVVSNKMNSYLNVLSANYNPSTPYGAGVVKYSDPLLQELAFFTSGSFGVPIPTPAPEPSSLAIALSGIAVAAGFAYKRRKR